MVKDIDISVGNYNNSILTTKEYNEISLLLQKYSNISLTVEEYTLVVKLFNLISRLTGTTEINSIVSTLSKILGELSNSTDVTSYPKVYVNLEAALSENSNIVANVKTLAKILSIIQNNTSSKAQIGTLSKIISALNSVSYTTATITTLTKVVSNLTSVSAVTAYAYVGAAWNISAAVRTLSSTTSSLYTLCKIITSVQSGTSIQAVVSVLSKILSSLTGSTSLNSFLYSVSKVNSNISSHSLSQSELNTISKILSQIISNSSINGILYTISKVNSTISSSTSATSSARIPSTEPSTYILDVITNLGYSVDVICSSRKVSSSSVYAGLITVNALTDYKVAWDTDGFISATSNLHNADDTVAGTIQTLIVDANVAAVWKTWYDNKGTGTLYDYTQNVDTAYPLLAVAGTTKATLKTFDGTHVAPYFVNASRHCLYSTQSVGAQPRTIICLARDWERGTFVAGSNTAVPVISKNMTNNNIDFSSWATLLGSSSGTFGTYQLTQASVAYHLDNLPGSTDFKIGINGVFESPVENSNTTFTGTRNFQLGYNYGAGTSGMTGYQLEYIIIPAIISDSDLQTIYNNQKAKFQPNNYWLESFNLVGLQLAFSSARKLINSAAPAALRQRTGGGEVEVNYGTDGILDPAILQSNAAGASSYLVGLYNCNGELIGQSSTGSQPLLTNGLGVPYYFNNNRPTGYWLGTSRYLLTPSSYLASDSSWTMFCVSKHTGSYSAQDYFAGHSNNTVIAGYIQASNTLYGGKMGAYVQSSTTLVNGYFRPNLVVIQYDGTSTNTVNFALNVPESLEAITPATATTGPAQLRIGARYNNNDWMQGYITEFILFNRALTLQEIQNIAQNMVDFYECRNTNPAVTSARNIPANPKFYFHAQKAKNESLPGNNTDPTINISDISGYNTDGIAVNPSGFSISSGWAGDGTIGDPCRFVFDGSDDFIAIPSSGVYKPTAAITISCWIKFHGTSLTNSNYFISTDPTGGGFALRTVNAKLSAMLKFGGTRRYIQDTNDMNLDTLYHIMLVYDGTNMKLYRDNVEVATAAYAPSIQYGTDSLLVLGGGLDANNSPSGSKNCSIYDARIYDYAFTELQRAQDFAAGIVFP